MELVQHFRGRGLLSSLDSVATLSLHLTNTYRAFQSFPLPSKSICHMPECSLPACLLISFTIYLLRLQSPKHLKRPCEQNIKLNSFRSLSYDRTPHADLHQMPTRSLRSA